MTEIVMQTNTVRKLNLIKGWQVELLVDEDGHLEVYVKNSDGTDVHSTDADISEDDCWGERFTTQKIEDDYNNKAKVIAWFKTDDESYKLDEFDVTFYIEHLKEDALQEMIDQGYENDYAFDDMANFYTIGIHRIELIEDGLWHSSKASKHGKEIGFQCGVKKETFIKWLKINRPHLVPEEGE